MGGRSVPHARSYYRDLLSVAISIIDQKGINFKNSAGRVVATSLVLRMDDVFERYLRNTLRDQAAREFPDLRILNGNVAGDEGAKKPLFDTEPSESAQPDIVVAKQLHDGSSQNVLVMDVKYKEKKPERSDINQIVTYAVSYRVKQGVIIQPGGSGKSKGLQLLGTMADINLYSYSFDLDRGNLIAEEQDFATAVSSLVMAS